MHPRRVRSLIEHVFAAQKCRLGLLVRTVGMLRARVKIGLDLAGQDGRAAAVAFFEDLVRSRRAPASSGSRPQSSRMRSWAPFRLRMMRA